MAQQPPEFIDQLANVIYQQEFVERATAYSKSRGLDPSKFRFPWAYTNAEAAYYLRFREWYPPEIFTDCLFMPVTAINNPGLLVGFDVRYLGPLEHRIRYVKFKRTPDTVMMYYTEDLSTIGMDTPILVTEGAADAESLRFLGFPVVSPLTAMHQLRFIVFLRALSEKIFIVYDNDEDGRKAVQKIMKHISVDPSVQKGFAPLVYSGKDPNYVLTNYGAEYMKTIFGVQIK